MMKYTKRVRPTVPITVTMRLLLLDSAAQVVGQIPVSPTRANVLAGSTVTFHAAGVPTCAVSGSSAPPGDYQLVAIVTAAPDQRPVFLPCVGTISSSRVDIVVH